jgi:vacuolar-type H+-ATPase subunit I/STV1
VKIKQSKPKTKKSEEKTNSNYEEPGTDTDILEATGRIVNSQINKLTEKLSDIPNKPIPVSAKLREQPQLTHSETHTQSVPSIIVQTPELAEKYMELEKYKYDSELQFRKETVKYEAEINKLKTESEAKIKIEKVISERVRDITNRKIEFLKQTQAMLQATFEDASYEQRMYNILPMIQSFAKTIHDMTWTSNESELLIEYSRLPLSLIQNPQSLIQASPQVQPQPQV